MPVDATIPRKQVSILAGASGSGKTTLLLDALARWSHGDPPFTDALTWQATKVAYLVADRTKEEVVLRAKRLGIADDKMEIYGIADDTNFPLRLLKNDPLAAFEHAIGKFTIDFDLLIVDTIALFVEGNFTNFHEVAFSMMALGRVAIRKNITILATHHTTKMHSDWDFKRPQDRISGSGAFQGFSGTQMVLIQGSESNVGYDSLFVIPHMSPMKTVQLVRGHDGEFQITQKDTFIHNAYETIFEKVKKWSPDNRFPMVWFHEQAEQMGVPLKACPAWTDRLVDEGWLVKESRGMYVRTDKSGTVAG
jgi:energy-coupling factor transporter ATP-binding protein EcfA2